MYIGRFLYKTFLVSLPLLILLALYAVADVFKVLRYHDEYYVNGEPMGVVLNAGHVATMIYDHNLDEQCYDSFIFGSSRSRTYEIADWKKHIGDSSRCFHFDGNAEPLYGVWCKVRYIDRAGGSLKNALFMVDHLLLSEVSSDNGHLYRIPPMLEDDGNYLLYHAAFVKSFLNPKFLCAYIDYRISGEVKPYMTTDFLLSGQYRTHEFISNEVRHEYRENLIARGEYYTPEIMQLFHNLQRPDSISPVVVGTRQKEMLTDICNIFLKHGTEYRIIINPLYNQVRLNPADVAVLRDIFGYDKVGDFSGDNEFTRDYHNYYDDSHYRPHVAREVMNRVYND